MQIGIDRIHFAIPHYALNLRDLAQTRGVDPDKYTIGIGQDEQAVAPSHQDIVTLGAQAAFPLLKYIQSDRLAMVIVGTESGIDASKSSALYIHKLLQLSKWVRCIEIKEACYGGTAALMTARDYVATHPQAQVLVIASDIARYGLRTAGEVTQGAGAVAMLVSRDPHLLALNDDNVMMSEDIADFWRPVYQDTAIANGRYSTEQYIRFFQEIWQRYCQLHQRSFDDFAAICFHLPYTKMGLKALRHAMQASHLEAESTAYQRLMQRYTQSTLYSRRIGNIYTGSLYLGLLSLLENDTDILSYGDHIGLFSYGSGAVGEFFSGTLVNGWQNALYTNDHHSMLDAREYLSIEAYETMFNSAAPYSSDNYVTDACHRDGAQFFLNAITDQQRHYC